MGIDWQSMANFSQFPPNKKNAVVCVQSDHQISSLYCINAVLRLRIKEISKKTHLMWNGALIVVNFILIKI